jgi:hypothetical protein
MAQVKNHTKISNTWINQLKQKQMANFKIKPFKGFRAIMNNPSKEKKIYYFLAFVASVCISAIVWAINRYA